MRWILGIVMASMALPCALALVPQEQAAKSRIVPDVSPEQLKAINELRDKAQHDLVTDYVRYKAPDIAGPLGDPLSFVAFVKVTAVKCPEAEDVPSCMVNLHVEQFLRGVSDRTELQAESRWSPPGTQGHERLISFGKHGTVLDYAEPKVGNQYLVGFPFLDVDKGKAHIFGAIDLDDYKQARLIPDVQRFLGIEFTAGASGFAPFVATLNDNLPWFRDLAALRLVQSDACNASPECQEAFLVVASGLLQSKELGERWEALKWLEPVSLSTREGLPTTFRSSVRDLLVRAQLDTNLLIADEAYRQTELLDFFHDAKPGECTAIFPYLRKTTRWKAGEADGTSIPGTVACKPDQASEKGLSKHRASISEIYVLAYQ